MNREDFPMLQKEIIYLDNGATTFKPSVMCDALCDYYKNYTANAHRGDYDIGLQVDVMYEKTREKVRRFINAKKMEQIVFTSGTTDSLNKIIFGFFRHYLKKDDEIILNKAEHASNTLPWFELATEIDAKVIYAQLDSKYCLTLDSIKKAITPKTKVISLAQITNVVGDVRDIKSIINYAHEHGILVVIDGAQSVPHMKVDVQQLDIDFLAFSAHKMCGPTGLGILYGKEEYLNNTHPIIFGGGMNATFTSDNVRVYKEIPYSLEAGTPSIADVIAFGTSIDYLERIGMDRVETYERELKKYAVDKLQTVNNIILYNEDTVSGIITFNIKDVFAQDLAVYLNKYHICVRAGNHCTKMLKEDLNVKNTCRVSLYFYNTKEEIDYLVSVLKNPNLKAEIL